MMYRKDREVAGGGMQKQYKQYKMRWPRDKLSPMGIHRNIEGGGGGEKGRVWVLNFLKVAEAL